MNTESAREIEQIIRDDGRYPLAAFAFLERGLQYAAQMIHGEPAGSTPRHVSGQQLCEGLRELGVQTWGPLALEVLARWNIRDTRDFGEMFYLLIQHKRMGRQDTDSIEHFDDVFDFAQAFGAYQIQLDE